MSEHSIKQNHMIDRLPVYFGTDEKPMLGWIHRSKKKQTGIAIIICQSIALDYMSSYRCLRILSDQLAQAGHTVFRFDYYGQGDSGGYDEDDLTLNYANQSIAAAHQYLVSHVNPSKVGLLGFRMGATFASLYAAEHKVDFLISWHAVGNGKRYLREIKALQMASETTANHSEQLEAAGMVYYENTQRAIKAIDLSKILPQVNRLLSIDKDESVWHHSWKQSLSIDHHHWPGAEGMLLLAADTIVPQDTFQKIVQWISDSADLYDTESADTSDKDISEDSFGKSTADMQQLEAASNTIRLGSLQGYTNEYSEIHYTITESVIHYGPNNQSIAILTNPSEYGNEHRPCIVILNSGAVHRVGSNRLHVLLSRSLAGHGYPCCRVDIPGIGDSVTDNKGIANKEHIDGSENFVRQILDSLQNRGYNRFIVAGLSSGAFYSYNAALRIDSHRIIDAWVINPEIFYKGKSIEADKQLASVHSSSRDYISSIKQPKKWLKLITGGVEFKQVFKVLLYQGTKIVRRILGKLKANKLTEVPSSISERLDLDLLYISSKDRRVTFVMSENDPSEDILYDLAGKRVEQLVNHGKLSVFNIKNADHTFSRYQPMSELIATLTEHARSHY